ncbi:DeoR family transcriptional regulator [Pseudovibrio japonicus]|uniref:DeoR family transcriptional regulator n=1 Tax=Pseudovibrio japonicus TaxID=366534 RepID=A0ABQ3E7N8_9HYPH|nr:DeoR/GlpR family DNA-binding transcription regulator [Pseudovibrio japonicus]GHB27633.1 DeoR family transcriptional regulator [Pseudovibrio japonicus]
MILNVPDTRQNTLAQRLVNGQQIVAAEAAQEFGVSLDTIRRDILALEAAGKAHRVRGGAVPIVEPALPFHTRIADRDGPNPKLIQAAVTEIGASSTLIVDGGLTSLYVIEHLPTLEGRVVMTPSPWVAIACQERGIEVFLLGGILSPQGGIATGAEAVNNVGTVAAEIAILGACGIDAEFGLSSDDYSEARMKKAMSHAARRTLVVSDHSKINRKARHQTLALSEIDVIVTDAQQDMMEPFINLGTMVSRPDD